MLLVASGFGFLALAEPASRYGPALGYQLVAGFGAGLAAAPATEAVLGAVPGERAGTGAAPNDLVREVGGALGIAVLGSLLAAHHTQPGTPPGTFAAFHTGRPHRRPSGRVLGDVHERPARRFLGRRGGSHVRCVHRRRLATPSCRPPASCRACLRTAAGE
ncbi:hypothetical protein P1P75_33220 [Streptomyces sp. ID05-39B]|uniref:hypothetical protein n=1 Tax=Streptomyces sp. ID05-39B TaxID=3028664 RepID=UPI0029AA64DD|nr:hypothetical protein [Streptomyces sp. ID05-39B]MDX3531139.1 hypothetical protein [Streptomyces sp. ID05-39B]